MALSALADEELPIPRRFPSPIQQPQGIPGTVILEEDDEEIAPNSVNDLRNQILKLKGEREALNQDRNKAAQAIQDPLGIGLDSPDTAKLRQRLGGLLAQIGIRSGPGIPLPKNPPHEGPKLDPPPPKDKNHGPGVKLPHPDPTPDVQTPDFAKTLDPLALAQALFQARNYQGALQAFRLVSLNGLKSEERAPILFLTATCLRKLGKVNEAATIYREVANLRGDENLASLAQWQLQALNWEREISGTLQDLRQRRQALETNP